MHRRVGLDIDGVFADYHSAIYQASLDKYGSVDKDSLHRTECSILDSYNFDFWAKLKPLPLNRTVENLLTHSWMNHDTTIYFLTRRPPCLQLTTQKWLSKHFGVGDREIVVSGAVEKARIAQGLLLDVFVDDDPIHCLQVAKYNPKTLVYLANRPGNEWFDERGTNIVRLRNPNE